MIFGLVKRDIESVLEEWAKGFKFLFDVIYLLPPHHANFRKRIVKRILKTESAHSGKNILANVQRLSQTHDYANTIGLSGPSGTDQA